MGGTAPTGGGGAGRRGGGGASVASRLTYIEWHETKITPAPVITAREGETIEKITEEERIRRLLNMSEWDARPTLLYFHFEHEDESVGRAALKQCKSLDDEKVARWSRLYNCVEVDVSQSSRKLLERWNVGDKPSFAVIDRDLNVVAESRALDGSKRVASFLKTTLTSKLGEYWKGVQEDLDDQKATYKEAQTLIRKKELERARDRLHEVRTSTLRVGDWWDDARKQAEKLDKELTEGG